MNKRITLLSIVLFLVFGSAKAQSITLNLISDTYSQDFNSMANTGTTGTTLPNAWYINAASYRVSNGGSNTGAIYSFGDSAASDRALGSIASGGFANPVFGVKFINNTGLSITKINLHFLCEEWRLGQKPAQRLDSLQLQYNIGVDSINASGWTTYSAGVSRTPDTSGVAGAKNGNVNPNRELHNHSITGLNIPNGSNFWIRWSDPNVSGSDDGLSIDSLSMSFEGAVLSPCTEPPLSVIQVVASGTGTTSIHATYTGGVEDGYVAVAYPGAITLPIDGSTYAIGDSLGTGVVVYAGMSTVFNYSGLTPNTIYDVYVYPYNNNSCSGGPNYKQSDPGHDTCKTLVDACPEPTVKPTNLVFTLVNDTTISGHFTKAVPAPAGYVVVFSTSSNVGYPNDSSTYAVGDSIKNGSFKSKVIYVGTDSNFSVTHLVPGTHYYFAVVPYNNCPGGPNYNRTTPLRDDTTTTGFVIGPCGDPTGVNNNSIVKLDSTATTITIKFTIPANADSVLVIAGPTASIGFVTVRDSAYYPVGSTIPGSNGKVYARGTDSVVTLTGLTANTVYKILIATFKNKNCTNANYSGLATTTVRTATATGVKYKNSEAEFSLYPNPTHSGSLFVKFANSLKEDAIIEVLDVAGRKLGTQKVATGSLLQTIDVSNFAKGTYILNVVYKGSNNVSTFMIE